MSVPVTRAQVHTRKRAHRAPTPRHEPGSRGLGRERCGLAHLGVAHCKQAEQQLPQDALGRRKREHRIYTDDTLQTVPELRKSRIHSLIQQNATQEGLEKARGPRKFQGTSTARGGKSRSGQGWSREPLRLCRAE